VTVGAERSSVLKVIGTARGLRNDVVNLDERIVANDTTEVCSSLDF
jgi:hypothetical protein